MICLDGMILVRREAGRAPDIRYVLVPVCSSHRSAQHPNRSFNEYDSFRIHREVFDWSSTWQKVTRENQRARRSWPRPPPVLWRAVVGKFAHPQRAICGCQACAARVRQNGLSGPSWTFADVSLCSSLGRFAARVGFWPPGRVGFLPLPVGGDCCRGGGCVRGRRAARTWLLLLVPFFG